MFIRFGIDGFVHAFKVDLAELSDCSVVGDVQNVRLRTFTPVSRQIT